MKFYNAPLPAPNPRRVRIFLAEKNITLPTVTLNVMTGEGKTPEHLARDPLGQLPTLELDDGTYLSETVAICRYLESLHPEPPLFGRTGLEQARVEQWIRRIELNPGIAARMVWVHTHKLTSRVVKPQYTEFGESNRPLYARHMTWLDKELSARPFIAGADYTMADICLLSLVDFATWIGLPLPEDTPALHDWHARVSARPSATA